MTFWHLISATTCHVYSKSVTNCAFVAFDFCYTVPCVFSISVIILFTFRLPVVVSVGLLVPFVTLLYIIITCICFFTVTTVHGQKFQGKYQNAPKLNIISVFL